MSTPKEDYVAGLSDRKPYEDRAKEIAKVTLPYIIRDDGASGSTELEDSNSQSYGARLVNSLKAKMGMALLPPSTSSFRFVPDAKELAALTEGNADNAAKVTNMLSTTTLDINNSIEAQQIRPKLFDLVVQLIVVGSCIGEKVKDKGVRLHTLKTFVTKLDSMGKPTMIVMHEVIAKEKLPKDITPRDQNQSEYSLYTRYKMMDDGSKKWVMTQSIEDDMVGGEKTFKDYDALPVRYFGWTWVDGDQYHRPYAEDYYKDLQQLDKMADLLTDGAIIAAKSLLFVDERGGRTRKDEVANSENGDVIDGNAADVTALQLQKNFDFQIPMEREANLKRELASAFLLNESATRDAERVTAAEIRFMAQELESSTLAGVYSVLAVDWSRWLVEKIMKEEGIKFQTISVEILTGLDALGRSQESQKLDNYLARMGQLNMLHWVNEAEVVSRYAAFDGIDTMNLIKTPEQVQEAKQQAQAEAAAATETQAAAQAAGQVEGQAIAGQPQQPPPQ